MDTNEKAQLRQTPMPPFPFLLMAVTVGVVAGAGAVVFRGLIALFHNLLLLGQWSVVYDANQHTPPSPWGPFVVLVPVAAAAVVAFMVKTFAPEAKGHGVPEVMEAIYYQLGRIRPVVAVVKALASALSIGSGGSVGREGPMIQIGSSFGSTLGQLLRVPPWQRVALVAGGAGGGIAATFNTPVGGVLFVLELIMPEVSARTLVPVSISVATATYVGRLAFGIHPSFVVPQLEAAGLDVTKPLVLLAYAVLGALMGAASALFIKALCAAEDFFEQRVGGSYYRQHMFGMLIVGLLLYGLMVWRGHYYIEGIGYATVQDLLTGVHWPLYFLLLLFALKLVATSVTLGSGASGGIVSPALFLGATLGSAIGAGLNLLVPALGLSTPAFAVAGMAGVVGGATGAAMAAIIMVFEMTLDYRVIIPMTIAVAASYGVRRLLVPQSIYTIKLARRGQFLPDALRANPLTLYAARQLALPDFGPLPAAMPLGEFQRIVAAKPAVPVYVVEDGGRVAGIVPNTAALEVSAANTGALLGSVADARFVILDGKTQLNQVIAAMQASGARVALVSDAPGSPAAAKIRGVLTRAQLADAVVAAEELFQD